MSSIDYSIDIVSLSKRFRRHTLVKSYTTIKSSIVSGLFGLFGRPGREEGHFTQAVKDLTLRVPKGASVGIIGQNGSGKSTLLKLITGIYKPDNGRISVNGRIAALIELGAGFHPDFTGRENLYLGGVMHGLSRAQINERFNDIVQFAELEDVIDDPVRTYSSGMFMRLGFSLAVHTDPDVLIIDEVLAVGDASFVTKCKERITALRKEGKTLLLVSHDLSAVERWCDEALWLHKGEVRDRGLPRRVIDHYREFVEKGEETELEEKRQKTEIASKEAVASSNEVEAGHSVAVEPSIQRWGSREVEIKEVKIFGADGQSRLMFHPEDSLKCEVTYAVNDSAQLPGADLVFGIGVNRNDGVVVHGSNTDIEGLTVPTLGHTGKVVYKIDRLGLLDGQYSLDIAVHRKDGYPYDYHKGCLTFAVRSSLKQLGVCAFQHSWEFLT